MNERRRFLHVIGAAAATLTLPACAAGTPAPTAKRPMGGPPTITPPRIENLRFIPESQVEPDDDVAFEFDIVNDAPEFRMFAGPFRIDIGPTVPTELPFPGVISFLSPYRQASSANGGTTATTFSVIEIPPRSSTKVYGGLSTQSKLNPGAKHPYQFQMIVTITQFGAWPPSGSGNGPLFSKDGLTTLAGVISPDK